MHELDWVESMSVDQVSGLGIMPIGTTKGMFQYGRPFVISRVSVLQIQTVSADDLFSRL